MCVDMCLKKTYTFTPYYLNRHLPPNAYAFPLHSHLWAPFLFQYAQEAHIHTTRTNYSLRTNQTRQYVMRKAKASTIHLKKHVMRHSLRPQPQHHRRLFGRLFISFDQCLDIIEAFPIQPSMVHPCQTKDFVTSYLLGQADASAW